MSTRATPKSKLILDWVYGYRGHQCHDNLFYNNAGHLVYFAAGLGIVFDLNVMKQQYYLDHDDDIISLTMASDGDLVASGQIGKEPYICVWSSVTMETRSILKGGHTHGISSLGFSKNGNNLVSVGLDTNATMCVWDWKSGKVLATTRAHSDRVFDARILTIPEEGIKIVTSGVKHIKFWTLSGSTLSPKKGIFGKVGEIQTMLSVCQSSTDPSVCYAGTASGDVYKWAGNTLAQSIPAVHKGAIYSIQANSAGYVTGGKDGVIVYFDIDFQKVMSFNARESAILGYPGLVIRSVHCNNTSTSIIAGTAASDIIEIPIQSPQRARLIMTGHGAGELWALAPHPKKPIFATGSDDKCLKIWQIIEKECLGSLRLDIAIRSCGFNNDGSLVAVGLNNGSFRVFRTKDFSEVFQATNRKEVIHELKFSPNGHWLAIGSNDNFVDFYDATTGFKKTGTCKGNSSFITHLDWSADSGFIRTNSGASEFLIFKAPTGDHITNSDIISSIKWHESTGVLGSNLQGIWEKYTDTNDVNAAHVNGNVVATGDDFGLVKLIQYPCPEKGAHFKKYTGHCAHVTNVRWSSDGRYLVSIGGSDQSILQWRYELDGGFGSAGGHGESDSEGSDSGLSDIDPCDSELEKETGMKYERAAVSKEEASRLQEKLARQEVKKRKSAPSMGVVLEHVHGYRGYDCRGNLYYLQKAGEVVYHVAAVGIVTVTSTGSQRHYLGHQDDILCLALHPCKDYVATGEVGKDPAIHVWDAETMKVISILKGQHERGVCALDFSHDGKKIASVGLDNNHFIIVWNWRKGEKIASVRGSQDKIFSLRYNPQDSNSLATVGIRHIRFWQESGNTLSGKRGTFGTVGKLETQLCVVYDVKQAGLCYTGSANGSVYVWKDCILQKVVQAHSSGGCYAIDAVEKGFVTGGKDGVVNLYDETFSTVYKSYKLQDATNSDLLMCAGKMVPCVRAVILGREKILAGTSLGDVVEIAADGKITVVCQGHSEGEMWGLAAHPCSDPPICATVSDDGTLAVWQAAGKQAGGHRMIRRHKLKGPARCCAFSHDGSAIAVGFKDGSFVVLKANNFQEIATGHHRKEEISDIKFSPEPGKYLAVASHDNFVDLYSTSTHQRLSVCKSASSYITHIDWDIRGKLLMVNSGAKEQLFFEAPRGKRQTVSQVQQEKMEWGSGGWSCVLGDVCQGMWPPKCDITDVNATSLSRDGSTLATGDDFGRVKLFSFPCKTKFAKFKQYNGHSAHVTNVKWLNQSNSSSPEYLTTIGGADTALMVWRHKRQEETRPGISNYRQSIAAAVAQPNSDLSDTDSEEENGYDSDVEREKNMDWAAKTYSSSVTEIQKAALKNKVKETKTNNLKKPVSRDSSKIAKVQSAAMRASLSPDIRNKAKSQTSVIQPPSPVLENVTQLDLEYVHGYRGFDCRNNLHYMWTENEDLLIVYHAAAVGIVLNPSSKKQQFYRGHTDDILCLAVNRHPKYKGIVASGEIGSVPAIHVWQVTGQGHASAPTTLSIIQSAHTHGICSLNFSSTGTLLLSVGIDPQHTIVVTKWEEGTVLAKCSQQSKRIFLAEFRPDSDSSFVDVGVKHVKFWSVAGNQLVERPGLIPANLSQQQHQEPPRMTTMLSVAFGTNDVTYTGAMNGNVWVWQGHTLTRVVNNVHSGPVFVLHTTLEDGLIVSGGKEKGKDSGSVKLWDQAMTKSKPFYLSESVNVRGSSPTGSFGNGTGKKGGPLEDKSLEVIRAISRVKGKILVGSQDNDVIEIQEKTGDIFYVIQSHGEGVLTAVTQHPLTHQFASCSTDGTVKLWDLDTKKILQTLTTGPATSLDYQPTNGNMLLICLQSGAFVIISTRSYRLLVRKKDRSNGTELSTAPLGRWSPNGDLIAIATSQNQSGANVDIYKVTKSVSSNQNTGSTPASSVVGGNSGAANYTVNVERVCYIKDLGSPVQAMDWCVDSQHVRLGLSDLSVSIHVAKEPGTRLGNSDEQAGRLVWATWTSIAGEEVVGVWTRGSEKDVVNTACVSHQGSSIATGDDYGLVKVFPTFPVAPESAPSFVGTGHSAHVTSARFTADDSHLITAGGDDCCIFVWKCS